MHTNLLLRDCESFALQTSLRRAPALDLSTIKNEATEYMPDEVILKVLNAHQILRLDAIQGWVQQTEKPDQVEWKLQNLKVEWRSQGTLSESV